VSSASAAPQVDAWRDRPAAQQPRWPDPEALARIAADLRAMPPLVVAHEVRTLRARLAGVARGEAFLLQGGHCAETFAGSTANQVRDLLRTLLQMALVLTYGASLPVVKVGRIAGQFAKPRSADTDALGLPSYRGDAVNDITPDPALRVPDPTRLMRAYATSASVLNLIRAFATGGLADLRQVHAWNQDFVRRSPAGERYERMATDVDRALGFMRACGFDLDHDGVAHQVEMYASHEALLLDYEAALTRVEDAHPDGPAYDLSAHTVWLGERTRQLDGAHVAFAAAVANPIGVKLGPTVSPEQAVALAERLDPERDPGRLSFIVRAGAAHVETVLPPVVEKVQAGGWLPVWICDPMHGNTRESANGYKTRHYDDVLAEVQAFFAVHRTLGSWPGGVHLELTGDDVTECLGGGDELDESDLDRRYETACDPRLNTGQALEIAFRIAEMLQEVRHAR
jgi:3-deoxy-7-phosphoheptulonate synthase